MKQKAILLLVLVLLTPITVSASPINDFKSWVLNALAPQPENRQVPIDEIHNKLNPATITSYQSSVPVQIGYNDVQNMWIITGTVGWKLDTLALIKLPTQTLDNGRKAQKEVTISLTPLGAFSSTGLTKQGVNLAQFGTLVYYDVEGSTWKTQTRYAITDTNSQTLYAGAGQDLPAQVSLGNGAWVENLGILPNGANIISGDFVMIETPDGQPHIVRYDALQSAVYEWNVVGRPIKIWGTFTYQEVFDYLKSKGKFPTDVPLAQRGTTVKYNCGKDKYFYLSLTVERSFLP